MSTLTTALSKIFDTGLEAPPEPARKERRDRVTEVSLSEGISTDVTAVDLGTETMRIGRAIVAGFEEACSADISGVEDIFVQRTAPVGSQDPWKGVLRPTYNRDELLKAIEDGLVWVVKDGSTVQAFALVITDAKSPLVSLERLALKLAQFFERDEKKRVLDAVRRNEIVYIAGLASREDSNFDPERMYKSLAGLAEQYREKTILLTCSYRPIPNQRIRALIEPCTKLVGQFSTPWKMGRPGLDGVYGGIPPKLLGVVPWIFGKWTSLIYEVDREKLSKLVQAEQKNR